MLFRSGKDIVKFLRSQNHCVITVSRKKIKSNQHLTFDILNDDILYLKKTFNNIIISPPEYTELTIKELVYKIADQLFDDSTNINKFIDEIYNPGLREKYEEYKKTICLKRGSVQELDVFHGTHANLIDIIASEGFDPTKSVTASYGKGTYFAKNASYSKDYMKSADKKQISYMFLVKLAVGKCEKSINSPTDFDNYVDNKSNPTIFVCPNKYAAYPEYVIAFYKDASKM